MDIPKNVGDKDAYARTAVAGITVLIALFAVDQPILRIIIATIAAILAGTAFLRLCPLYIPFKMNTRVQTSAHIGDTSPLKNSAPAPTTSKEEAAPLVAASDGEDKVS